MGWAGLALSAVSALSSMQQGSAAKKEADFNASLYEKKAEMSDIQAKIEAGQYDRAKRQIAGTTIANTAKGGLGMGGSPMAVLIDNLTQIEMDKQIGQYNLQVDKMFSLSQAENLRIQGKRARSAGIAKGFATLMMTAYAAYGAGTPKINTSGGAAQTPTYGGNQLISRLTP